MSPKSAYEPVIGLEVHVQLLTRTKLFCGCATVYGAGPNEQTCPVCLGHPGVLPVMNAEALRLAVRFGLAVGATVHETSVFARKNYFYPDLPKGYQVSQYERPIVEGGHLDVPQGDGSIRRVRLTRAHLEEDAGKTTHLELENVSHVDFNRTGTPLLEIVSEPDLRSSDEASDYLKELRNLVRYLAISDGHMEQGSFRCDANVSVRPVGQERLGTRVELKNINSFSFVKRAIDYEIGRQVDLLDSGGVVTLETRLWDERAGKTRSMRSKEEAHDYRYFPEPDLLPLHVPPELRAELMATLPELPSQRRARYVRDYALSPYDAAVLTGEKELSAYFEQALAAGAEAKAASNWIAGELKGRLNADGRSIADCPVEADDLARLLRRVKDGRISGKQAKEVFARIYLGEALDAVLEEIGEQVTDTSAIDVEVSRVLALHQREVEKYRAGNMNLIGYFVGHVIRAMGGKANPQLVREALLKVLDG